MIAALREHILPFLSLLLVLAVTAIASGLPLGQLNIVVALAFSAAKTCIVAIFFMELRRASTLNRIVAWVGLVWLSIFLMLILTDYLSRFPIRLRG